MFWSFGFLFKIMMITAPMVYWWTGTAVISSTIWDMVYWLAPYMLSGMVFMGLLAGNTVFPIMTDVTQLLAAPTIVRTVVTGFIKPWGHPFKVTAKGVSSDAITVQWSILLPFGLAAVATALGMLINITPYSQLNGTPGYTINVFWSIFNLSVLCIACAVCVELPKRRRDERFFSDETVVLCFDGHPVPVVCKAVDLSLGGANIQVVGDWPTHAAGGIVLFDDGALSMPFEIVRVSDGGGLAIRLVSDTRARRALIRKLFTGTYDNEVERVRIFSALFLTAKSVFR
jgi:cellulose synthase (UDP-forming)